jgi:predicted enzyme related to lactoylglutathione lyase
MPGPARAGILIYAKELAKVSLFYERVLDLRVLHADNDHNILESPDIQLIIHAIPAHVAASVAISIPPEPREEQAIKPFFSVPSLAVAERIVESCGGKVCGPIWPGPGMRVRNVCDPEGNIMHLREGAA